MVAALILGRKSPALGHQTTWPEVPSPAPLKLFHTTFSHDISIKKRKKTREKPHTLSCDNDVPCEIANRCFSCHVHIGNGTEQVRNKVKSGIEIDGPQDVAHGRVHIIDSLYHQPAVLSAIASGNGTSDTGGFFDGTAERQKGERPATISEG